MGLSFGHILLVLIAVVILFGLGKLPNAMADVAKGIRAFKKEMDKGDDEIKSLSKSPEKDSDAKDK